MKNKMMILAVAAATFVLIYGGNQVYNHYRGGQGPELCHLASEGFVLTDGDAMILMDALYREGFPEDQLPSDAMMTKLEAAESPYDKVDLVTVSHKHIDHFGIPSIMKFMENNKQAHLLMPVEAAEEFFAAIVDSGGEEYEDRVHAVTPERGAPETLEAGGITVTVYNLDHRTEVENIGVLFEVGDKSFFHMGDFSSADFEENGIAGLKVDYLLVPYWYLRNEQNFQFIKDNIEASHLVPMHLPRSDPPGDYVERIGSFEDLMAAIRGTADNVLVLYDEGACIRPEA